MDFSWPQLDIHSLKRWWINYHCSIAISSFPTLPWCSRRAACTYRPYSLSIPIKSVWGFLIMNGTDWADMLPRHSFNIMAAVAGIRTMHLSSSSQIMSWKLCIVTECYCSLFPVSRSLSFSCWSIVGKEDKEKNQMRSLCNLRMFHHRLKSRIRPSMIVLCVIFLFLIYDTRQRCCCCCRWKKK